ncbi:MAG: transporter substrate-binding domain-containing protein [Clostridia bacterium]|nr:transporter substrate-binding domain-containing protein [Clostridia bacterium]
MKKLVALVLVAMMALSCLTMASAESAVDMIKAAGQLVVETEATYPPYEYLDDNGNFAGCDIWLAQQIADELGVTLVIQDTAFDSIITDVKNGDGTVLGIAAFTKTPERAEVIDFSDLYETSAQLLVVKKGDADVYTTKEALAGKKVGAQMGTVQSQLIEKALPDSELFELEAYGPLSLEVKNGNIAGFVADAAVAEAYVSASEGTLEVANFEFTAEEASFGKAVVIKQGNQDLVDVVNAVIAKVTTDGSYQKAYDDAVAATGETGD